MQDRNAAPRTANRLSRETSPYLLQHQYNPVNWWPWGDEAFATARAHHKPVFLSIGYAACHWCHVMERESFEDEVTADLLNRHFIAIKVDREERPDIDNLYMEALHRLGEQGGWPLSMFLTPEREPFWGGTYFPPEQRYGRPSFRHILTELSRIWTDEPDKIASNATALTAALAQSEPEPAAPLLPAEDRAAVTAILVRSCDPIHGGLKGAPKFPQAPLFTFLWAERHVAPAAGRCVELTIDHLRRGGIYDHLGGGIARYSVDQYWLVPHFEKMLYDNAQFISLATRIWAMTRDQALAMSIAETIAFLLNDFRLPEGAFGSSYDADSEGIEGKYYLWSLAEIMTLLPPHLASEFCAAYDVSESGNFEGQNILNLLNSQADAITRFASARATLLATRRTRIAPGFDDKALLDWNALAISALATAAFAFGNAAWADAAETIYDAVGRLLHVHGTWHHSYRAGQVRHYATADGLANLIEAAIMLHAATGKRHYIEDALRHLDCLDRDHRSTAGVYYLSSARNTDLIARKITIQDDATPNANGTMACNLVRLFFLNGNPAHRTAAETIIMQFAAFARQQPFAAPSLLRATTLLDDGLHLKLIGAAAHLVSPTLRARALDGVIEHQESQTPGLIICRGQTCSLPLTTAGDVDDWVNRHFS